MYCINNEEKSLNEQMCNKLLCVFMSKAVYKNHKIQDSSLTRLRDRSLFMLCFSEEHYSLWKIKPFSQSRLTLKSHCIY